MIGSHHPGHGTYPPLDMLKPVADDIWVVDGPLIGFGPKLMGWAPEWLQMPFPTRMTVIRLPEGLFVHSPTPLTPGLKDQVERIGRPRWVIGPSRLHHWWIPEWQAAFPDAGLYLAPRILEQAAGRIEGPAWPLDRADGYPWDHGIRTLSIPGRVVTEVEFFHLASRTLILTDLIENFEPGRVAGRLTRLLVRLGGVRDPDGSMPRDMRLTFPRPVLKAAVETMIGWGPERVILAHGRWYDRDGTAELERAFRWLLGRD